MSLHSTINFASIMGIREDTQLKGQEYAWLTTCGSIYQMPACANMLMPETSSLYCDVINPCTFFRI